MEGRHPDVLEMDAASNTGVDNIREIIESARYKPMVARYKVYLIDEVHMLSKGAFNALLKTLEEPPDHVKFIFATTEVRKVPLTVLSRCQRFDLRRVDVPVLVEHFKKIVANEGGEAEDEALAMIARAAEGSVRDGLSLLDQALAMSAGKVEASRVRDMLGLADRGRIFDLLEKLLGGATGEALDMFAGLHRDGAEPAQVAGRSRRGRARDDARQDAGCGGGRRGPVGRGAAARRGAGRTAVGGDPGARLADAAQGPGGDRRRPQSGGRGRDGADPAGLSPPICRRPPTSSTRSAAARRAPAASRAADRAPRRGRRSARPSMRSSPSADEDIRPRTTSGRRSARRSRPADPAHLRRGGRRRRASGARPSSRCTWKST